MLVKNTALISLSKMCTQMISFFLLPLYTGLLNTEEFGTVDLLNMVIIYAVPIVNGELSSALFRFLVDARNDETKTDALITTGILVSCLQCVAAGLAIGILSFFVHNTYSIYLLFNLIAALLSNLFLQICRGLGKNVHYSFGSFLTGAFTLVFNLLFLVGFHMKAEGMLLASLLANFISAGYLFVSLNIKNKLDLQLVNQSLIKKLFQYSIPLIPNIISWGIINGSDRFIISAFLGLSANGVYAVANKFSAFLVSVYSIFNTAWTESASLNIHDADREEFFSKIYRTVFYLAGGVCLGLTACMPVIYPLLVNQSYSSGYYQVPILIMGAFFNIMVSFLGTIYVALKKTKEIAKTSFYAAVINLAVNLLTIHFIGLYAASISTAVSFGAMFIYRFWDVQKYVQIKTEKKKTLIFVLSVCICLLFFYQNKLVTNIAAFLIALAAALYLNWPFLQEVFSFIWIKAKKFL